MRLIYKYFIVIFVFLLTCVQNSFADDKSLEERVKRLEAKIEYYDLIISVKSLKHDVDMLGSKLDLLQNDVLSEKRPSVSLVKAWKEQVVKYKESFEMSKKFHSLYKRRGNTLKLDEMDKKSMELDFSDVDLSMKSVSQTIDNIDSILSEMLELR